MYILQDEALTRDAAEPHSLGSSGEDPRSGGGGERSVTDERRFRSLWTRLGDEHCRVVRRIAEPLTKQKSYDSSGNDQSAVHAEAPRSDHQGFEPSASL